MWSVRTSQTLYQSMTFAVLSIWIACSSWSMSSWLSGGLNQLTDQISTFTKEVLTETTEEVTGQLISAVYYYFCM